MPIHEQKVVFENVEVKLTTQRPISNKDGQYAILNLLEEDQ